MPLIVFELLSFNIFSLMGFLKITNIILKHFKIFHFPDLSTQQNFDSFNFLKSKCDTTHYNLKSFRFPFSSNANNHLNFCIYQLFFYTQQIS